MSEAPGVGVRRRLVSASGIPVLVVAALLATGAGLTAVLVAAHGSELGPPAKLFVLAGLMAASYRMTGWVSTRLHTPVWQTDAAILAAALVLLEPVGVVVAITSGVLVGCLLDRRSLAAVVGMVSNSFAMSATATTIVYGLADDASPLSARFGLSVAVGIIIGQILWELSFSAWYRVTNEEAFGSSFFAALRFGLPRAPFIAGIGYSAAVASTVVPWAGLFMVPALAGLVYVLAEHFKAERDLGRAEILFRTAEAAHSSIDLAEVDAAIVAGAGSLLLSDAELRSTPPLPGELGVALEGADPRWLIVSDTRHRRRVRAAPRRHRRRRLQRPRERPDGRGAAPPGRPRRHHRAPEPAPLQRPRRPGRQPLQPHRRALRGRRRRPRRLPQGQRQPRPRRRRLAAARGRQAAWSLRPRQRHRGPALRRHLHGPAARASAPPRPPACSPRSCSAAIARPFEFDGQDIFMSASAGLAFYPDDGDEPGDLLRNADTACTGPRSTARGTLPDLRPGA